MGIRTATDRTLLAFALAALAIAAPLLLPTDRNAGAAPQDLVPGWNAIVYQGDEAPPEIAFAGLSDALVGVWGQEPGSAFGEGWQFYVPAFPSEHNTLATMVPMRAYWVKVSEAVVFDPPQPSTEQIAADPFGDGNPVGIGGDSWTVVEQGLATWYGPGFEGNMTACGDVFDPALLTAASNTLPCGTIALVTNTDTGRSVIVKINDTGGFGLPLIIDLSQAAYNAIATPDSGNIPVVVEVQS